MIAAMTMPTMTHPGTMDWSGENPGMYLKENADGPFSTLVSFFCVVASPHGRGHGAATGTRACWGGDEAEGRLEGALAEGPALAAGGRRAPELPRVFRLLPTVGPREAPRPRYPSPPAGERAGWGGDVPLADAD